MSENQRDVKEELMDEKESERERNGCPHSLSLLSHTRLPVWHSM